MRKGRTFENDQEVGVTSGSSWIDAQKFEALSRSTRANDKRLQKPVQVVDYKVVVDTVGVPAKFRAGDPERGQVRQRASNKILDHV